MIIISSLPSDLPSNPLCRWVIQVSGVDKLKQNWKKRKDRRNLIMLVLYSPSTLKIFMYDQELNLDGYINDRNRMAEPGT